MLKYTANLTNSIYTKKFMVQLLFSIFLCLVVHVLIIQYFYYLADNFKTIMSVAKRKHGIEKYPNSSKFILVWNNCNNFLKRYGVKNSLRNCSVSDCIFTEDSNLLYDYMRYDAIIFNEFALNSSDRPQRRSKFQLYIFSSRESSYNSPACELYNDNFYNLTFTYRLDSDVLWSYFDVRDLSGQVIAPKVSVNWKESLDPVSTEIKSILKRKTKAAVWIVNPENTENANVEYIRCLQEHLFHYSLKIDVFSQPPKLKCPNNYCQNIIRDKYYFYIAFENSFSVDYVTDVVIHGYNNYAVPIVYGGGNYSRFHPPGSYINAREIHPYNLAFLMYKAIKDPIAYEAYFRWTNLYTINDSSKSHKPLCHLCEAVHAFKANGVIRPAKKHFRRWWNGLSGMKRCLSNDYWKENANLNVYSFFRF